jgi:hypothetical protein
MFTADWEKVLRKEKITPDTNTQLIKLPFSGIVTKKNIIDNSEAQTPGCKKKRYKSICNELLLTKLKI